ncbi:MAG: S1C family serine protease [Cellulosilyticaceae bacterium]
MDEQKRDESIIDVDYKEATPSRDTPMAPYVEESTSYYQETIKEEDKTESVKKEKKKGGLGKFVAGLLVVSMVGGASVGAGFALTAPYAQQLYKEKMGIKEEPKSNGGVYTQPVSYKQLQPGENPVPAIAEAVGNSVVSINNNSTMTTWMGEFSQASLGSGVVFNQDDAKVYIISNAHVVEGANTLTVTFLGNTKVAAHIVGYDTSTDIAVVGVNKEDIPEEMRSQIRVAPLGDSDALRVGEQVVAIGTPIDEAYYNTVSVGYISALGREISLTDQKLNLIQTDAAINPGNSGGALVGPTGEVIGINTMKLANSDKPIEGMGFAIPINDVKPIVEELMAHGKIVRPSLGITGSNMTEEFGNYWEIPVGILVHQVVPGSSAELAGIQAGDVIIEFDSQRIATMEELKELLREKKVGDQVKVKIVRGSGKKTIDVKLQEVPSMNTQG